MSLANHFAAAGSIHRNADRIHGINMEVLSQLLRIFIYFRLTHILISFGLYSDLLSFVETFFAMEKAESKRSRILSTS